MNRTEAAYEDGPNMKLQSSTGGFVGSKDQVHSWSKNMSVSKGSLDFKSNPNQPTIPPV